MTLILSSVFVYSSYCTSQRMDRRKNKTNSTVSFARTVSKIPEQGQTRSVLAGPEMSAHKLTLKLVSHVTISFGSFSTHKMDDPSTFAYIPRGFSD